jgi:hypothetical protein
MQKPINIIHLSYRMERLTICGLGEDALRGDPNFISFWYYLDEALEVAEAYPYDEQCEICWRDLELKLLAYVGED